MEEKTTLHPAYELRAMNHGIDDLELALWQMPSPATPHIVKPLRIARLRGRNLALVEGQILRTLKNAGVHPAPQRGEQQSFSLEEEVALNLGLLWFLLPCATPSACDRLRKISSACPWRKPRTGSAWPCTERTLAEF